MDACDEVLVQKCAGRRTCSECGKGYNVADVFVSAGPDRAEPILMPPMPPPKQCSHKMLTRPDDAEAIVKRRLDSFRIQVSVILMNK
jgi:adenylate kinase